VREGGDERRPRAASPPAGAGAAFKAFEAAGWSERAATYGALMARATAHAIEPLLDAARVSAGSHVLDVAAGLGDLAAAAAARGAIVTGVDLAPEMVRAATERHPQLTFVGADAEDLPFDGASFDAVVGAFVVNHLPEPERGISEMVRVSRGRVALAMWAEEIPLFALPGAAADAAGLPSPAPPGPDAERFADRANLLGLLAGLHDISERTVEFELEVPSLDALWEGVLGGTVRTAARLAAAPDAVKRHLARLAEPYRRDGGYALPTTVRIVAATRSEDS
jgi:SAM-dependent methyltransferase